MIPAYDNFGRTNAHPWLAIPVDYIRDPHEARGIAYVFRSGGMDRYDKGDLIGHALMIEIANELTAYAGRLDDGLQVAGDALSSEVDEFLAGES